MIENNCVHSRKIFDSKFFFYNCNFNRAANCDDENVAVKIKPLSRDCIKPMALIAFFGRTWKARFHNPPPTKFFKTCIYIRKQQYKYYTFLIIFEF